MFKGAGQLLQYCYSHRHALRHPLVQMQKSVQRGHTAQTNLAARLGH